MRLIACQGCGAILVPREVTHHRCAPAELARRVVEGQPTAGDPAPEPRKWPLCQRCGRKTSPGLECTAKRCPWQRVDGKVVAPTTG